MCRDMVLTCAEVMFICSSAKGYFELWSLLKIILSRSLMRIAIAFRDLKPPPSSEVPPHPCLSFIKVAVTFTCGTDVQCKSTETLLCLLVGKLLHLHRNRGVYSNVNILRTLSVERGNKLIYTCNCKDFYNGLCASLWYCVWTLFTVCCL